MAYVRFGDTDSQGREADVYIYMSGWDQYELRIAGDAYESLPADVQFSAEVTIQDTTNWGCITYPSLASLVADTEMLNEYVVIPEFLFERLERQRRQDIDAQKWAEKILKDDKDGFYVPLPEELPLTGDEYPYDRVGLRDYVERIAPKVNEAVSQKVSPAWKLREHLIGDVLDILLREAGVDKDLQDPNWYLDVVINNRSHVCDGSPLRYTTNLDKEHLPVHLDL